MIRKYNEYLGEHEETVDSVVDALGAFRPDELELLSTLLFLYQSHLLRGSKPTVAELVEDFRIEKGDKFEEKRIREAISALEEGQLIDPTVD